MAIDIQLKLSTLKAMVDQAEQIHAQSCKTNNPTIPVVRITKTAFRQEGQLEDKYESSLLVETVTPFEVVEG